MLPAALPDQLIRAMGRGYWLLDDISVTELHNRIAICIKKVNIKIKIDISQASSKIVLFHFFQFRASNSSLRSQYMLCNLIYV